VIKIKYYLHLINNTYLIYNNLYQLYIKNIKITNINNIHLFYYYSLKRKMGCGNAK